MACWGINLPSRYASISYRAATRALSAFHAANQALRSSETRDNSNDMPPPMPTRSTQPSPSVLAQEIRIDAYQCTPRINAAKAICSWLGAASFSALRSPLAAAESGNSSKAVFITTS